MHCAARTSLEYPLARIYGESVQIAIQPLARVVSPRPFPPRRRPAAGSVAVALVAAQNATASDRY